MSEANNSVHPLVRKVRALQGALAEWRYDCDLKDLRAAMWLEADVEQLAIRIEAVTHVPNMEFNNTLQKMPPHNGADK